MEIELDKHDGIPLARVSGKLDTTSAPELQNALEPHLDQDPRCIMDLSGVKYISSAGLRVLLVLGKKAKTAGGGLAFCGLQGMVREVLAMAYFDTLFPTEETVAQAAAALRA